MKDFKNRISKAVICKSDSDLEILTRIADESKDWVSILNAFSGKLVYSTFIGFKSLRRPHKMKYLVLDWFRYLLVDNGIKLNDVTAGAFLLSLKQDDQNESYDFDTLIMEIKSWAKREFNIDVILAVVHATNADEEDFYSFRFITCLSGDIAKYKELFEEK